MVLLPLEPESSASASSAISAYLILIYGQPRPRDSCGCQNFFAAWSAEKISTAAPLPCSLGLPQAALTGKLPVPPYPHIKFSSSKFYTVRTSEAKPYFRINLTCRLFPQTKCFIKQRLLYIIKVQKSSNNTLFNSKQCQKTLLSTL